MQKISTFSDPPFSFWNEKPPNMHKKNEIFKQGKSLGSFAACTKKEKNFQLQMSI